MQAVFGISNFYDLKSHEEFVVFADVVAFPGVCACWRARL
jgi:hypothetical protein